MVLLVAILVEHVLTGGTRATEDQLSEAKVVGKWLGITLVVAVPALWAAWRAKHPRQPATGPSLAYRLGRLFGGR